MTAEVAIKILDSATDLKKFSEVINLVYVSDTVPGIRRVRKGKGFSYLFEGRKISDAANLERIRKLVIPPAWKNVWICCDSNGHLQATGYDARNRKQYRYHAEWNVHRNETKFYRLPEFGKNLPALRRQVEKDISDKNLTARKVIAAVIRLMEHTYIRIGNAEYEKQNGSFGLTTMKDHHVKVDGGSMRFSFRGKRNILHRISLQNRKLARIVKQCRDIPGKELFQYYGDDGEPHKIDSGKVNEYLKEVSGFDFTAKDFRTWAGTLNALRAFAGIMEAGVSDASGGTITGVIDQVSKKLGNTRSVCRKYYIHPGLISMFQSGELEPILKDLYSKKENGTISELTKDEQVLIEILSLPAMSNQQTA